MCGSRNALQHVPRATLYGFYTENVAPQNEPRTRTHILCERAQSKRMSRFDKSHFMQFFCWKNAALQSEHPDQAPAFTPTVRTPLCGHTIWGLKKLSILCFLKVVSNCRRGRISFSIFQAGTEAAITKPSHHSPRDFMRASREFGSQLSERARPPPVSLGLAPPRSVQPAAAACECA